ncbi:MAG: type II toxin-antitoxin system VapC family toxin [Gammaproteobacteria bacterium]
MLDTHVLLWLISGDEMLGIKTRTLIDNALHENKVAVSAITFWEVALLQQKSRIEFSEDVQDWRRELIGMGVTEISITGELGVFSTTLEGFHADPADRFIVASAIMNHAKLLTADNEILNWKPSFKCMDARK